MNPTTNSIILINNTNGIAKPATKTDFKIKINEIKLKIKIWPAVMFANNRMVKAIGLVNIPIISTGIISGYNHQGTCGLKICPQ